MAAAAEQGERGRDWAARWPCLPQLPGQWKPWAPGLAWVRLLGPGAFRVPDTQDTESSHQLHPLGS